MKAFSAEDRDGWTALASADADSTVCHTLEWPAVIEDTYGCPMHHLVAERDGRVTGLLPLAEVRTFAGRRVLVSLPFSNYGGPLGDTTERAALVEEAGTFARRLGALYVELRMPRSREPAPLVRRSDFVSPILSLDGWTEGVWRRMHSKTRNQIQHALKSGTETRIGVEHLDAFARVYIARQHELGSPTHGVAWFHNMAARLGQRMDVAVIYRGRQPIGGVLLLFHRDTCLIQYGASLGAYHGLCPNNAAYWSAVRTACERGCVKLDLGRTRPGSGSSHFKYRWGAIPVPTPYEYILLGTGKVPDVDATHPRYRWPAAAWKRLPLPVARWLGPRIRPHVMV